LAQVIRDGKPGTAMSAYGQRLSAAQIQALVDYIRRSFMTNVTAAMPGPAVVPAAPVARTVNESEHKALGRQVYETHCAVCHGDQGNTAIWARNGLVPAPRNFTTELSRKLLGRERMIQSVTKGRPGTGMMSFANRLRPNEIEAVVDYIRSEFMHVGDLSLFEAGKLNSHADKAMPQGLQGNAKLGRAFFMANCADCHGTHGNGKGPRAYFNRPAPRDFTTADSRAQLDRPRLFNSIKHGKRGSVMPAWGAVLSDQEIANVAEFVYQHFIQQQPVVAEKKS